MENVVVDSSVAVKWFVVEPHSDDARKVLDGYKAGDLNLLAPDLINSEIGNIVWKKHRLQGLSASDAQEIIDTFQTISFTFIPTAILLDEAYRLAVVHQRTVYDMMYVALSIRERCRFVTADDRLVNAIATTYSNVIGVANWT
jgi:predicted nucleic acid-binding protein